MSTSGSVSIGERHSEDLDATMMPPIDQLRQSINTILDQRCPGKLPDANQPVTTCFSMNLAWELGKKSANDPLLTGAPHSPKTKDLAKEWGIDYVPREFLVDFCVLEQASSTRHVPLLGCESEAHKGHGVEYTFEVNPDTNNPVNGYVWDFRKLLHFRAPKLLFVARLRNARGDAPGTRMDRLIETLRACAKEYADVWRGSLLYIVLLPPGNRKSDRILIGYGAGGSLHFEPLTPPVGATITASDGSYSFRIRFVIPDDFRINAETDDPVPVPVAGSTLRIELSPRDITPGGEDASFEKSKDFILTGQGYASAEEAQAAGDRCRRALLLALTRVQMGFDLGGERTRPALYAEQEPKFREMLEQRGVLVDAHGLMVHPSSVTGFARIELEVWDGIGVDRIVSHLASAINADFPLTPKEELALELYGASYFEHSDRARFVMLVTSVEALLDPGERPEEELKVVADFRSSVKKDTNLSKVGRDALLNSLGDMRRRSIGRAGRELASERLGQRKYMERSAANFFRECYDIRSKIVHEGEARGKVPYRQLIPSLQTFVSDLICAPYLPRE